MSERDVVLPSRAPDLYAQEVGDEVVVVDPATQQAHALSGLAADIWRATEYGTWAGPTDVEFQAALEQLIDTGLLVPQRGLTRRRVLQGVGALAVVGGLSSIDLRPPKPRAA